MQTASVASITVPLTTIFERIMQEGGMSPGSEKQMFDQLQRMETWLIGNGTPGILTRMRTTEEAIARMLEERKAREAEIAEERREAGEKKRNGFWYRLAFQAATVGVALILGAVWNNYINHAPSPVDKKLATTEEQIKTEIDNRDKRLDSIEDALARIEKASQPVKPRATGTRGAHPTTQRPEPQRLNMLREGELIAPRDREPPRLSYNRLPFFEIKAPE